MTKDAIVLGAGIVGISTAIHLQRRGRQVILVDRKAPGKETSFGNAGLIQREGVVPYGFPQQFGLLLRYAFNNRIDAHYHLRALPGQIAFLARYWWNSNTKRHEMISRAYAPLIEHSISEHNDLIEASHAEELIRKNGWMEIFRTNEKRDAEFAEAERLNREFGVAYDALTGADIATLEPHIRGSFSGGLRWRDPWSVLDPHGLIAAYRNYFESIGGRFATGDALSLGRSGAHWKMVTSEGSIEAEDAVVALGPWADLVTKRLGYAFPLGVKRGYHMHYAAEGDAILNNWTLDAERGYFLAPMSRGIRLTTGAEFALRDAPKTPIQLDRAEAVARTVFPLGERLDPEPWMGARPCTPDMMPIIGKAPRHNGLWFAFGHAHHGLTLGPVTGRVLAELITGEKPFIDISAYAPDRFAP
ncbi:NAD(P)/FAD-dependent oxidoreductase [Rhizobium sp. LEGMi198b]|uniref:NAD(P)/FAD-dependent oxidoreductase n=1 Tax=unclassified Rhizobium TaxID=2613769 RepID=UPI000CDF5464|nr:MULTISPECIES: FAD-binding oxidoreductase [Rhizobium]AVA20409.1 FAD dependent oxidoreductase protein [Rhizobium sp. NXC24]MDK4742086.1 FAD-binding oxidoreductase [Rhizobium sp. CNPSo 3464]UWU21699.1 FAD-binding oxidoreductase [Rhizobium tropici]WFU02518.1 FAD-binding oxidoreductase [Rhizobium sp. CB3171]